MQKIVQVLKPAGGVASPHSVFKPVLKRLGAADLDLHDQVFQDIAALRADYDVLSLDIFDTAILRNVLHPDDVFLIVAERGALNLKGITPARFQTIRRAALKQAYRSAGDRDVTLDQIYAAVGKIAALSDLAVQHLKRLEVEVELEVCCANPFVLECYRKACEAEFRVIFVSDMHLPLGVIEQILRKNGYEQFYGIFVSSEHGVTKHDGKLFEIVIKQLEVHPQRMLHIGDTQQSDIAGAQEAGLSAVYYKKSIEVARAVRDPHFRRRRQSVPIEESRLKALIVNELYSARAQGEENRDFWYRFGFSYVGPLLYDYTAWLIDHALANRVERLFFLSRDGYILEKVLQLFHEKTGESIPHSYLYVSRRALVPPAIEELDEAAISYLLSPKRRMGGSTSLRLSEYFAAVGFDIADYPDAMRDAGFDSADAEIVTAVDDGNLRRLLVSLREPLIDHLRGERELVLRYLEQEGFFQASHVGIVDVGWYGSMQRALQNLCVAVPDAPGIEGFYLGTYASSKNRDMKMHGYIVDRGTPPRYMNFALEAAGFIELILSAPHASVVNYALYEGVVVPCLGNEPIDGQRAEIVSQLHEGALNFVRKLLDNAGRIRLPRSTVVDPLRDVFFHPSELQVEKIGSVPHYETFGPSQYRTRYLAQPNADIAFWDLRGFTSDYHHAFWKSGYLQRSTANPLFKAALRTARRVNRLRLFLPGLWG